MIDAASQTLTDGGCDQHVAHHFGTAGQQYSASKLGMWLFLATEVLMFGGLFCVYAVFRANHPDIFLAGHQFLDKKLGALNTGVLLCSSFSMAWAVRCAQLSAKRGLIVLLVLTLCGGAAFMGVKGVEYYTKWEHGLTIGHFYHPDEAFFAAELNGETPPTPGPKPPAAAKPAEDQPDADRGKELFNGTCASCHGPRGQGLPHLGANLFDRDFIPKHTDKELLQFVKTGRQPWDADSVLKLSMPARGGNPSLDDDKLRDIIAYIRVMADRHQKEAVAAPAAESAQVSASQADEAAEARKLALEAKSFIAPAAAGPAGLSEAYLHPQPASHRGVPQFKPAQVRVFFAIYFLLTGLHGIHVLVGMGLIAWLLVKAIKGRFSSHYFTPVDNVGLYWHLVDLIWIFLFPLLYLIH